MAFNDFFSFEWEPHSTSETFSFKNSEPRKFSLFDSQPQQKQQQQRQRSSPDEPPIFLFNPAYRALQKQQRIAQPTKLTEILDKTGPFESERDSSFKMTQQHQGRDNNNRMLVDADDDVVVVDDKNKKIKRLSEEDSKLYSAFHSLWIASKYHRPELYAQWMCLLQNIEENECENTFQLPPTHVLGIIHLCKVLNTNHVIKFRAIELYDRYLRAFAKKMAKYCRKSTDEDMEIFYERYESQIILRMCTCILIASKLHADTQIKALRTEKIKQLLEVHGLTFTVQNVARSEMRILEILNFRCHWTIPLDLVEQLLCLLDLKKENLGRVHYFCRLLLEFCYTDLDNIRILFYQRLKQATDFSFTKGRVTIPLQCAAIVSAALFIVSAETKTNLENMVAQAASLPECEVDILTGIILDLLKNS